MNDRDRLARLEFFGIKLGLDTIAAILAELDLPHSSYPVIHLAGTNGKGSVARMVSHALTVAGRRTGRYTSPHLVASRSDSRLTAEPSPRGDLDRALHRVRGAVATLMERGALDVEPTYFEITTAAAFEIFRDQRVDIAVVEVGTRRTPGRDQCRGSGRYRDHVHRSRSRGAPGPDPRRHRHREGRNHQSPAFPSSSAH
jgi:dihydrofolate synthase/folylpolyglutamate synthase